MDLFKAYQTFEEFNETGVDGIFLYPAEVVPYFIPMLLFALFIIAMLGTFFSQKRTTGQASFVTSFAAAGYFVTIVAFMMTLVTGLIDITTLIICVTISILGTVLLLVSKDRN